MRNRGRAGMLCAAMLTVTPGMHGADAAQTWRGMAVAPEHRCTPYERDDYPYPQSVEARIVAGMGGRVYGPYTGRHFASRRETDIEHRSRHRRRTTAGCVLRTRARGGGSPPTS